MGSNNENIYAEDIWNRIAELLKERSVKQSWLVQRCKEIGMPISQPELSKLYTRKKKINVYELLAIAKALEVSVDFLAYKDLSSGADLLNTGKSQKLLSRADSEQFNAYLGEFNIYYNKTSEQTDEIQKGHLKIFKDSLGYCEVRLQILTGEYRNRKEIVKEYTGRMLITMFLSGAYMILKNEQTGELCFMELRHRMFAVKQLECRLALCLTMSEGENRVPTVHKMLLFRQELTEEHLRVVRPYLDLYGNVIRIDKEKANQLADSLNSEAEKEALQALWNMMPGKQYYEVSIELLLRHLHLSKDEFAAFISKFLSFADTQRYSKIYENDDNLLYALIEYNDSE
ncbi:MAG: hypothetical protein HDR71_17230 [Lachnospiraceae bacterium]|nr:hypothetical protein [Lachnospiraceae bacterium]MBD5395956.1 hypothetical protein [Lachnospiraceae bacterium]